MSFVGTASDAAVRPFVVGASQVVTGGDFSCALTSAGGVQCWGDDNYGQLGDGSSATELTPVAVYGLSSGVTSIAAGQYHACALTSSGAVQCWGYGYDGELGNGSYGDSYLPVAVSGLGSGVTAISAGGEHSCAVTSAGAAECWGYGGNGELGNGGGSSSDVPVAVVGLSSGVATITAGHNHTCALTTGGAVKCWGYGGYGQLGNGSYSSNFIPVSVSGLSSGVTQVTAGGYHSCALLSSGSTECWGDGYFGQLGTGNQYWGYSQSTPVFSGVSHAISISAGFYHTCAVTTSGAAQCWGDDEYGQIGNGSNGYIASPTGVFGLSSGVASISAGGPSDDDYYAAQTCAVLTAGGVECWGYNGYGQVGDGTYTTRYIPVTVTLGSATPGQPTAVTATPGNGALTVLFTAPAQSGSSQIESYTATCTSSNGGATGTGVAANSPVLVSGLTNGKSYTCTVHATNSFGDGPESSASGTAVPNGTKPGAPTSVSGAPGNASINVSFTPPTSQGSSSISSYTATCTSNDGGATGSASGAASPVLVTGLTNNDDYTCTVHATNSFGDGPESSASADVVPVGGSVVVAIGGVTAWEGNSGHNNVDFAVTLSNPQTSTVTVGYTIGRGPGDTATPGSDYIATSGVLTFAPIFSGKTATVGWIPVTIFGDTKSTKSETFTVTLTYATNATLGRSVSRAAIMSEAASSGIHVSVSNAGIVRGDTVATVGGANTDKLHVLLSKPVPAGHTVTVKYEVVGVTAVGGGRNGGPGIDFQQQLTPVSLTFTAGQQDKTIQVRVFPTTTPGPNKFFNVVLTSVTGATVQNGVGVGTIINES